MNLNKILIVNTFGIGDVLHTSPLVSSLRKAYPQAQIDFLANRRVSEFLVKNKKINSIYVYERDEFVAAYKDSPLKYWQMWQNLLQQIKQPKYDVVFDLSMNRNLNLFLWLAGIPMRVGYNYKNRGKFLTHKLAFKGFEKVHVADHFLELLSLLNIDQRVRELELAVDDQDLKWASKWLDDNKLTDKLLIALLPGGGTSWGANAKFRRWQSVDFAALADKVIEKSGAQIILMGDPSEKQLCEDILSLMKHDAFVTAGQTSITELSALLRYCKLSISNDGGPLHIAVGSGVKTISIFGPVDDVVYGPYPAEDHKVVKSNIVCQPCYRRFRMPDCKHMSCLKTLTVDSAFEQMKEFL